jgi:uncharacterized protein (TIGR03083 family)
VNTSTDSEPLSIVRATFLELGGQAADLIANPRVVASWEQPSALDGMTVGALAVHLAGAASRIDEFLDAPEPEGIRALPPARFFRDVPSDLDSDVHRGVRESSLMRATAGPAAVAEQVHSEMAILAARFKHEPPGRRIRALFGLDMYLDGYLITRMVELAIHTDDLAVSVEVEPPALNADAATLVIDCLAGVARGRHGDRAVMRAFAGRDQAIGTVLKVF